MTRLIVEEDGQRRAFRVHDGKLTIGSGPDATLKLTSEGVADLHVDIEVHGGRARLRPRPGVVPPLVRGVPVPTEIEVPHKGVIKIGAATLMFEYDHVPPPRKPPVHVPATAVLSKTKLQPSGAGTRPGSGGAGSQPEDDFSPRVPRWLVVILVLAVAGGAVFVSC